MPARDHGKLPDWTTGDLPEPLPLTGRNALRTIGPGAILLAGAIGAGEWVVGPLMAAKYGTAILWVATAAIVLQMFFNLEAIRYTLATGEPVLTGVMRLSPGQRVWGTVYVLAGVAQLATPALALGCANVLFAAAAGREPDAGDGRSLMWVSDAVLAICVVLLLSGRSVERTLERLSWAMIVVTFGFLLVANVLFVPPDVWARTAAGFLVPRAAGEHGRAAPRRLRGDRRVGRARQLGDLELDARQGSRHGRRDGVDRGGPSRRRAGPRRRGPRLPPPLQKTCGAGACGGSTPSSTRRRCGRSGASSGCS